VQLIAIEGDVQLIAIEGASHRHRSLPQAALSATTGAHAPLGSAFLKQKCSYYHAVRLPIVLSKF
jgi:hypothetical protein